MSAPATGFADTSFRHFILYCTFSALGAAGDDDGDVDLIVVRGDVGTNLLYRNDGDMEFVDVAGVAFTESATGNHAHAAAMFADIDGDADLDLFVGGLITTPRLSSGITVMAHLQT